MATSETSPASAALPGVTGAPGIAIGRVAWLMPTGVSAEAAATLPWRQRLEQAQAEVARHLDGLAAELAAESKPEEAAIFEAQAMLASDPALLAAVEQRLDRPLQEAVVAATEALAEQFAALDNAYLRERAADVRAVGQQIAAVLVGGSLTRSRTSRRARWCSPMNCRRLSWPSCVGGASRVSPRLAVALRATWRCSRARSGCHRWSAWATGFGRFSKEAW